jgi:hypothetical protein
MLARGEKTSLKPRETLAAWMREALHKAGIHTIARAHTHTKSLTLLYFFFLFSFPLMK